MGTLQLFQPDLSLLNRNKPYYDLAQKQQEINNQSVLANANAASQYAGIPGQLAQAEATRAQMMREQTMLPYQQAQAVAQTSSISSASKLAQAKYVGDKYGKVKNEDDLINTNAALVRMGVLNEDNVPKSLEDARTYYEGSEMHQLMLKHQQEQSMLDKKFQNDRYLDERKAQLTFKQMREQNAFAMKMAIERSRMGLMNDVAMQQMREQAEMRKLNALYKYGAFQAQQQPQANSTGAQPIEGREYGGPVNASQPYVVGENGPELFVPEQQGTVVPNGNPYSSDSYRTDMPQQMPNDSIGPAPSYDAAAMTNPQYQQIMNNASQALMQAQTAPTAYPEPDPNARMLPQTMQLSKQNITDVQGKLMEKRDSFKQIKGIIKNFDPDAFSLSGRVAEKYATVKDYLGKASVEDKALLDRRTEQQQNIDTLFLQWRKFITGVAGGEREMEDIRKTILNTKLSPEQAKAAAANLYKKLLRDSNAYENMLTQGIPVNDPSYTRLFDQQRSDAEKQLHDYIKRFKTDPRNADKHPSDFDAIKFKIENMAE